MESAVERLKLLPWAAALINDPKWTSASTASRVPKPSGEDSFFAETLATDRTIRAMLTLRPVKEEEEGDLAYTEIVELIDIGDGLNGFPQIVHGGFIATMLDEVCGVLIVLNIEKKIERLKKLGRLDPNVSMNYFTAYLNTTYKRPVPTPGVVLCTAKIERHEGRKLYVRATVEDGAGMVYTTGEAMFVEARTKL